MFSPEQSKQHVASNVIMRYVFLHRMQDVTLLTLSDVFSKQKRGIDSELFYYDYYTLALHVLP